MHLRVPPVIMSAHSLEKQTNGDPSHNCIDVSVCVCVFLQGFVGLHVRPKLDTQLLISLSHLLDISLHFVQVHHQSRGIQG